MLVVWLEWGVRLRTCHCHCKHNVLSQSLRYASLQTDTTLAFVFRNAVCVWEQSYVAQSFACVAQDEVGPPVARPVGPERNLLKLAAGEAWYDYNLTLMRQIARHIGIGPLIQNLDLFDTMEAMTAHVLELKGMDVYVIMRKRHIRKQGMLECILEAEDALDLLPGEEAEQVPFAYVRVRSLVRCWRSRSMTCRASVLRITMTRFIRRLLHVVHVR